VERTRLQVRDCFGNSGKLVTWISRRQKSFARFQMIAQLIKDKKISFGDAILKSVEERGLSRVIQ
jgi:hypothetical protein